MILHNTKLTQSAYQQCRQLYHTLRAKQDLAAANHYLISLTHALILLQMMPYLGKRYHHSLYLFKVKQHVICYTAHRDTLLMLALFSYHHLPQQMSVLLELAHNPANKAHTAPPDESTRKAVIYKLIKQGLADLAAGQTIICHYLLQQLIEDYDKLHPPSGSVDAV